MAKSHPICSIPGCGKNVDARGYCGAHYARFRKHGDPFGGGRRAPNGAPLAWLQSNVAETRDICLLWPFSCQPNGYGAIRYKVTNTFPHRVMCRLAHGDPSDEKMEAAHSCGNQLCCNPKHLSWKTHIENEADKVIHGTSPRGAGQGRSKLTANDVLTIRTLLRVKSNVELGEMFGVHGANIHAIRIGRSWAWLP